MTKEKFILFELLGISIRLFIYRTTQSIIRHRIQLGNITVCLLSAVVIFLAKLFLSALS